MTPMLQHLPVFLKDFDDGLLTDYWSLTTTHYRARPRRRCAD